MTPHAQLIAAIFVGAALLILARRWGNDDDYAGSWIAGAAMAAVIIIAIGATQP